MKKPIMQTWPIILVLLLSLRFPVFCHAQTPAEKEAQTTALLAKYPAVLGAYPTRIGNSSGGTTLETPVRGATKRFNDGAPMRLAVPFNARKVGLETGPPPKQEKVLRLHSDPNEGGWHETYFDTLNKILGGTFDRRWIRTDFENRTDNNAWEFGTGWWSDDGFGPADSKTIPDAYRFTVPFKDIPEGQTVDGYSWRSDEGGLVINTPKGQIYGLVAFETAVTDPGNANLAFSEFNTFTLNWGAKGNGKELVSFAKSFDWQKYPFDPRQTATNYPGPLGAVRAGGDLYVYSGEDAVMIHQWDAVQKLLVPVGGLYVRPDGLPSNVPNRPKVTWGQATILRFDGDGKPSWQVIDANSPQTMNTGEVWDIDASGNLYWMPQWDAAAGGSGHSVMAWKTLDLVRGLLAPSNLSTRPLPTALASAPACEQTRIEWKSGDLVAFVQRAGEWRLERYPDWLTAADPKGIKASYSVGPVALSVRRQYASFSAWNGKWHSSPNPAGDIPLAGFGTMQVLGDFVFIAEAQAGGVKIHRLSDGAIAGRVWDTLHTNSTIDHASQIQVTESATEFRVWLMDFHGKSVLVWRVPKAGLAANLKAARG